MSDESIEREQLRKALLQHWPLLTTAILSETFPTDASPGPFIQSAIAQDGPDKARFVAIFDCLERNAKETTLHRDQIQSELTKRVEEYEADLVRATRRISDFDQVIATQTEELLETRAKITGLNAEITRLNSCVTQHNERISTLQDEKTELQTRLAQATTANGPPIHFGTTPKARRTTTNPDKFTAGQQDTAKRQSAYERWKTQVEQILVVDAECFPKALDILTFITSLLGGKAWDAVQDGVQTMNANPKNSQLWTWQNLAALWEALDKRYMLLDSTQSAKNMLDTLHQGNRAYGDFKADFDHYADKARLDSRSKVDMLRKRLNGAFTAVIDNQITLPAADDYAGWTNVTDNIARNLQQKEHITKLRNIAKPHLEAHAQDRVAPAVDAGDPMELDRIRISDAERRRRTDNDLCLATPVKRPAPGLSRNQGPIPYEEEDCFTRAVLLDRRPLALRSIKSNADSLLVKTFLSDPRTRFPSTFFETTSLIDSGSTVLAFADDQEVVKKFNLVTKRLLRPRSLRLADGTTKSTVSEYFTTRVHIGNHTETMPVYVTNLGKTNPIILGIPWLKLHNPTCFWTEMRLVFNSPHCRHHCLPWDLPAGGCEAPRAEPPERFTKPILPCRKATTEDQPRRTPPPTPTTSYRKTTVEDVPDEEFTTKRAHPDGDELLIQVTPKPAGPAKRNVSPSPVVLSAGSRRPTQRRRPTPILKTAGRPRNMKLDTNDIRCVQAMNFLQFCKQEGSFATTTTLAELRQLVEDEENLDMLQELPRGFVEIPQLKETSFRRIMTGDYTLEDAKRVFDPYFHDFLQTNLDETARTETLRRKIMPSDIDKFLAEKPRPTAEDIKSRLPAEFHHHVEHFLPKNAETLPPHRHWDHKIELVPGKQAPYSKNRPFSPEELRCIKKWIDENLAKGWIRASSSPAAAPLLLAAKPGGGIRICQDYRGLNAVTIKNRYPLPLIRETLDSLCNAKFYTKLDVIAAFNRVRVAQGHEWMTAFITRFGLYESLVTPFGLCNAPATFQNYINHLLHDALDVYCTAYLDDVLVYSRTRKEHTTHVNEVIRRLGEAGLQIDIGKSEFYTQKTKYLGLIISTSGLSMDPEKVKAIVDWQDPTSVKELQQFLGFANFYRRFIQGYSGIIEPLTRLLRKETAWSWTSDQRQSFEELKNAFTKAPILAYFDYSKRTVVETDASNWASGGVLSQYDDNGKLRPVAFFSAKHSSAECNYEIYDKELLAIVKALEEWRPELYGTRESFEIYTDHKNLQTFMTTKQLNQRQVRWAEFLSQFNFQITYRPGSKATLPDALSRLPGSQPAGMDDERLQYRKRTVLPAEKVHPTILEQLLDDARENNDSDLVATLTAEPDNIALIDLIREGYDNDSTAQAMVTALQTPGARRWPKALRRALRCDKSECKIIDGLIYFRGRLFVPDHTGLRLAVAHRTHSSGPAGHPGRVKTIDLLNRSYWWPGLSRFAADFVKGCALCFRTKTPRSAPPGFLKPLEVPLRAWADISMDHIVDLPECTRNGKTYRHILVVVDRLTKMRHLIPVTGLDTDEVVDSFLHHVFKLHGAPDSIISDRGSAFVSGQRYEDNANARRDEAPTFRPGDQVMVSLEHMATNRPKKKWDDKWDGPFPVLKVYKGAVVVDLPDNIKVDKSFHTSQRRIAKRDDDGIIQDEWQFEKILDVHDEDKETSGLTYLVKWKHYDEPTWQPEQDLKGCKDVLKLFHDKYPEKPGPPNWVKDKRPRGRPRKKQQDLLSVSVPLRELPLSSSHNSVISQNLTLSRDSPDLAP
ncbi:hypothetical protein CHGG_11115 [Chaetomium globosum CBS 148.51]|uniref:RNA-directed DNA polymerase n=1 Tax=Chaetomium globosum (strain ATCC 6205 / CBS 148.51 / DSM 1962 / NBRC 6347 / NRRL 1970) TaxID=306901 RepID=Q2GLW3_CHAGB|nr:uncharacterized protein CHGG_11115 [Chaetomium globosum CBS 148.51]EAQ82860.1 hypothetical protein CHGG_11115 [Chaetomium globosum CBS 148.51]